MVVSKIIDGSIHTVDCNTEYSNEKKYAQQGQ
jgi:hypothetical protein